MRIDFHAPPRYEFIVYKDRTDNLAQNKIRSWKTAQSTTRMANFLI